MRASVFMMTVGMAMVGAPVWAQYKCTSPSGQVSFQQQPCAGQQRQQALDLKALPPPSAGTPAPDFAKQNAELDKRLAIRAAIEERRPVVGMTVSELQLAMGAANNVNRSQAGDVVSDQHVYQRGARTVYVYTRNGVVTSIQDTASGQASASVAGKCLSRREIWELEVEASRNDIRYNEAAQERYRRRIALAKDCN